MNAATIGRHIDDATLRLWMHLVVAGGYSHLREIRREWCPDDAADVVEARVTRLVENGMLRERQRTGKHRTFGVTTSCAAPPGYEHFLTFDASRTSGADMDPSFVELAARGLVAKLGEASR